jgi:hypothetical protein
MVANWGHGDNPDGYDDLPLVCGGGIVDRDLPWQCATATSSTGRSTTGSSTKPTSSIGVLYPAFEHLYLPFEIDYGIAQHDSRLCNQPWQRDLKLKITNQARACATQTG